jgi:(1->4)-alpha-D-glucan 1-alpha-D-glucosylmutase
MDAWRRALNEEYFIYQTLAGAWPWRMRGTDGREEFLQRMQQYMTKALSEAKVNLSWTNPNPAYVDAVHGFLRAILMPDARKREPRFVETMDEILPALRIFGAVNSLAQVVLKVASPGVPDFYQGTEMWDLSLVDPDNRRPVDYEGRRQALAWLQEQATSLGELAVCHDVLERLERRAGEAVDDPSGAAAAEPDGGYVPARRLCAGGGYQWFEASMCWGLRAEDGCWWWSRALLTP